jgi:hypothetical protein
MSFKPTQSRLQDVSQTTAEVFNVGDSFTVNVGEFTKLTDTGSAYMNYSLPEIEPYEDITGEEVAVGLATKKVPVKLTSSDDLYQIATIRDHERQMGLAVKARAYMRNGGATTVNPGEDIAPIGSGFQKWSGSMQKAGKAEQKIANGKWGIVRIDL